MKKYISNLYILSIFALLFAAQSCTNDDFDAYKGVSNSSRVKISAYSTGMMENYVDPTDMGTRASDPKNQNETEIKSLHIFLFDEKGNFLTGDYNNSLPYVKVNGSFWEFSLDALDGLDNVNIVALANIDGAENEDDNRFDVMLPGDKHLVGGIEDGTRDTGKPYTIKNRDDLLRWTYAPRIRMEDKNSDILHVPSAGMPMYHYVAGETHDLTRTSGNLEIPMTALMARVDVSVKLEPKATSIDGKLPVLTITSYGIRNMPTTIKPFKIPGGTSESDCTEAPIYVDANGSREIEVQPIGVTTINKDATKPITFTYYTYENIRLPNYDAVRADNGEKFYNNGVNGAINYPDEVKRDKTKQQRWKSKLARTEEASALILKGQYTTDQGLTYNAQFTVYMGSNPNDDFKVKRNHQYSNNIVIKGLDYIRNSDDDVFTFDGRVNVVDNNPLYLAIVNERMVDAHATALPMDVWMMYREAGDGSSDVEEDHTTTVTVTIPEGDKYNWIRMVMIPRKEMEDANFEPGTGIEPYFTTDLLDRINKGTIISGKPGRQCGREITIVSNKNVNNSRSRIYFYIDENVPTSNDPNMTNPNASDYYGDRMVPVTIKYETDKEGVPDQTITLQIQQKALLRVSGTNRNGDTGYKWMEYYEEYLEHSDPLDKHLAPGEYYTDGLPWGLKGKSCNSWVSGVKVYENYIQGYEMTRDIVGNKNTDALSTIKLYNNTVPQSAFHYCYGKNKRTDTGGNTAYSTNAAGNTVGWYMPGITELEGGLTEYYLTFKEFQDYFYWSAASAKTTFIVTVEENNYARATKVIQTTPEVKYAESGGNSEDNFEGHNKDKGRTPRDTHLRIRAFYKIFEK